MIPHNSFLEPERELFSFSLSNLYVMPTEHHDALLCRDGFRSCFPAHTHTGLDRSPSRSLSFLFSFFSLFPEKWAQVEERLPSSPDL